MNDLLWAGIGARNTPRSVLADMTALAGLMADAGWHLSSGGAHGADSAFAAGTPPGQRTLWLPWPRYNGISGPDSRVPTSERMQECLAIAGRLHPAWHRCKDSVRKLHARNVAILLGPDLVRPVDAIVCFTEGGQVAGGTGMGLRIAAEHAIPVFNLGSMTMQAAWDSLQQLHRALSAADDRTADTTATAIDPKTMARVIHLRDAPPDAIRIDRRTAWGNPFRIGPDGTREEVIAKYRDDLWKRIHAGNIDLDELATLHGKDLACHCAPLPCHGDALAEAAAWVVSNKHRTTATTASPTAIPSRETASLQTSTRTYAANEACVFRFTKADWGLFSNFAELPKPISAAGHTWPTSEHVYQAAKFRQSPEVQTRIAGASTARDAVKLGRNRSNAPDADWISRRVDAMRWAIRMKREANPALIDSTLQRTGDLPIVEYSGHDSFWGAKPKDATLVGQNILGRLWMELRQHIRDGDPRALASAWPDPLTPKTFAARTPADHIEAKLPASLGLVTTHRRLYEASQDGLLHPLDGTSFLLAQDGSVSEDLPASPSPIHVRLTFDPRKFPFPALRAELARAFADDAAAAFPWRAPIPLFAATKIEIASEEHKTRLLAMARQFSNVSLPAAEIVVAGTDIATAANRPASTSEIPALQLPDNLNATHGAMAMAAASVPRAEPWTQVLQHALERDRASFRSSAARINALWFQLPWLAHRAARPAPTDGGEQGRLWAAAMSTMQWPAAQDLSPAALAEKIAGAASLDGPNRTADLWLKQTLDVISAKEPIAYTGSTDEHAGLAIQLALLRPDPSRFNTWTVQMPELPPAVAWAGATLCGWRHGYRDLDNAFRGDTALQETIATSALAASVPDASHHSTAASTPLATPDPLRDERTRINNRYIALLEAADQNTRLIPYQHGFDDFRTLVGSALDSGGQPAIYADKLVELSARLDADSRRRDLATALQKDSIDLQHQLAYLQQHASSPDAAATGPSPHGDALIDDCVACLDRWNALQTDPDIQPHIEQLNDPLLTARIDLLASHARDAPPTRTGTIETANDTSTRAQHPIVRNYLHLLDEADNKPELLAYEHGFEELRETVRLAKDDPDEHPDMREALGRLSVQLDRSHANQATVSNLRRRFLQCSSDALDLETWASDQSGRTIQDSPRYEAWKTETDKLLDEYRAMTRDSSLAPHLKDQTEAREFFDRRIAYLSEERFAPLPKPEPAQQQTLRTQLNQEAEQSYRMSM